MISVCKATSSDLNFILALIADAKDYMQRQGFLQWTPFYPMEEDFARDIELQRGYILLSSKTPAGYAALSFEPEPCYDELDGEWLSKLPYAVIHRLAVKEEFRGTGAALQLILGLELICKMKGTLSLRTDTHRDNLPMQGLLKKAGFTRCGTVVYPEIPTGDKSRVAFEKLLSEGCSCG
ncbi:MAG: GNAT family N-acetyltransferase [Clostridia bacterium]|nr:GNAT family N-acetyltransferase [Clostridia bacterium]